MEKIQIAREIFLKSLNTMKKILDLVEFKFDKRTKEFRYFRQEIMNNTYENLYKLFKTLKDNKILENCPCGAKLRQGYKVCIDCGGSGFRNKT